MVYSFSTKTEEDRAEANKLKQWCANQGINFSSVIIRLIKEYNDQRRTKNTD